MQRSLKGEGTGGGPGDGLREGAGGAGRGVPGGPLTEFGRGRPILPLPSERVKNGIPSSRTESVLAGRSRPEDPHPSLRKRHIPVFHFTSGCVNHVSERVSVMSPVCTKGEGKGGGPGGRCLNSVWPLHRGSHPHPSPLPQGRGRKSGSIFTDEAGFCRGLSRERVRTAAPGMGCARGLVVRDVGCPEDPSPISAGDGGTPDRVRGRFCLSPRRG